MSAQEPTPTTAVAEFCSKCGNRIGVFRYWTRDGQYHPRCAPVCQEVASDAR